MSKWVDLDFNVWDLGRVELVMDYRSMLQSRYFSDRFQDRFKALTSLDDSNEKGHKLSILLEEQINNIIVPNIGDIKIVGIENNIAVYGMNVIIANNKLKEVPTGSLPPSVHAQIEEEEDGIFFEVSEYVKPESR